MKPLFALATVLSLGCALAQNGTPRSPTPIWVRSHNVSVVDVYLLCGDHDAEWLGAVDAQDREAFDIPAGREYCVQGLNFFLVVRRTGRGYWVGPFRPRGNGRVDLVIEKYAGLSSARVIEELP
jgi:hypothetical protein